MANKTMKNGQTGEMETKKSSNEPIVQVPTQAIPTASMLVKEKLQNKQSFELNKSKFYQPHDDKRCW